MKTYFTLLFVAVIAFGCNKSYKYVAIIENTSPSRYTEEKESIIKAPSDSAAYLEAYLKFQVSLKVQASMIKQYGDLSYRTIDFKLLNSDGENIANSTFFATKLSQEELIKDITNNSIY